MSVAGSNERLTFKHAQNNQPLFAPRRIEKETLSADAAKPSDSQSNYNQPTNEELRTLYAEHRTKTRDQRGRIKWQ